jgi:hypothetical protein
LRAIRSGRHVRPERGAAATIAVWQVADHRLKTK